MSESLRNKIEHALKNPGVELDLTPIEAAELDAYMALVSYFESQNAEVIGHA